VTDIGAGIGHITRAAVRFAVSFAALIDLSQLLAGI